MKKNILYVIFSFLAFFYSNVEEIYAQGTTCETAEPFCAAGGSILFPNTTGVPSTGALNCLLTIPNPSWFYLQISESGDLIFEILQNSEFDVNGEPIGVGIDVDFAVWGPFNSPEGHCDDIYDGMDPVDCSYSNASIETMEIFGAQIGEYYIVLITNYTSIMPGIEGFIRFTQTNLGDPGAGATDCSILFNEYVCEGGTLTIEATDIGGSNYQWYIYNEVTEVFDILPGEDNPTLEVDTSGLYLVEYLDSSGAPAQDEIQVNLIELPYPDFAFEDEIQFCKDEEIVLDATPNNIDDLVGTTYIWYYNGVEIPDENEAILNYPAGNYGEYTVDINQIIEDCGLTDSIIVIECMDQPDCLGEDFVEDFATGEGRFETPYTNLNFQPVGEVGGGDYAVSNTSAGMNGGWHVTTDHTGNTNGMMFVVNPEFFGDELYRRTITVTPNVDYSLNYWMTTMYDIDTAICSNGGDPSNITLRVEDVDGNLIAESSTGDVPNSSEPNWIEYGVNFNSADNTEIQFIFINNASGAMGCGNDLAIDDISLYYEGDLPVVVTPEDMEQCDVSGTTSTFDLTTQIPIILDGQDPADFNITFHLSEVDASNNASAIANPDAYVNTTNPETIFVRVERADLPTCFAIVDFDLIVTQGFEITTNLPESVALCEGDEFPPLDATPTDPNLDLDLMTYEWYFDGNLISEEAILIPDQAGIYTVILVYDGCSTSTVEIEVIVQERPLLDLGEDQILCDGDSFEIIPVVAGVSDDATYLWNTGANTETLTVNSSGTYTLEITDGPCVISDSIVVTFGEFPDVELGEDIRSCPGEIHVITATTSHSEATFAWYENEVLMENETGNSIQIVVSEEIVNTSVTYRVEVNSNGCISTDEITVHAYENNPNCIISQGLSPDDTPGYNDFLDLTFLAQRTGVTNLQIMNRHGRLVYEKNNYVNEWAGQSKEGELLPTGTYYYVINLSGSDPVYGNQITGWIYVNRK